MYIGKGRSAIRYPLFYPDSKAESVGSDSTRFNATDSERAVRREVKSFIVLIIVVILMAVIAVSSLK